MPFIRFPPARPTTCHRLGAENESIETMELALDKIKQDPTREVLGAYAPESGRLIGTAMVSMNQMLFGECRSFMVIEDVVVSGQYRRRGVGAALMAEAERLAYASNCAYIMLMTDHDRDDAQRFYESLRQPRAVRSERRSAGRRFTRSCARPDSGSLTLPWREGAESVPWNRT